MERQKPLRITYLDTARGYLMMLVILGHICNVLNPGYDRLLLTAAQEWIACFHMPAFFIIHGMLLREKPRDMSWAAILAKRFRTMIVPYLFFEALGMLCRWAVYGQSLLTGLYNLVTIRCNVGADWFLPALLMGNLLAEGYRKRGKPIAGWMCVAAGVLLAVTPVPGQAGVVLRRGFLAYVFIMLGILLPETGFLPKKKPQAFALCFFITAVCAVLNLKFGGNDFYGGRAGNALTLLPGGICGTVLVLLASRAADFPLMRRAGQESLTVMGTHQTVIYGMTALIPRMRGGILVWGVVLFGAIAGFEGFFIPLANRCFPRWVGKQK